MPEVPALLAHLMERQFGKAARVAQVDELGPRLRRVRFEGSALRSVPWQPGQEVEFRVGDHSLRHYTPASFDAANGTFDVVFFRHGPGPGISWAEALRRDHTVIVLGPGGSFGLNPAARTHVLLGDETTLGLHACLARHAVGSCIGAIEVDARRESDVPAGLEAAPRGALRGDALVEWLRACSLTPSPATCFYLAGHAPSIARLRRLLRERGWSRQSIRTKPYWAEGKRGL